MSLSQEWFEKRAARMDWLAYRRGHTDLELFMRACGFTWADLVAAGLVREKELWSTGELLEHEPTAKGKALLLCEKAYDILMVKKGKGLALVDAVRAARQRNG